MPAMIKNSSFCVLVYFFFVIVIGITFGLSALSQLCLDRLLQNVQSIDWSCA